LAQADAVPDLAGQYAARPTGPDIVWPGRHFLGEPAWSCDRRAVPLGCVCGFSDCWPLPAQVDVRGRDRDLARLAVSPPGVGSIRTAGFSV